MLVEIVTISGFQIINNNVLYSNKFKRRMWNYMMILSFSN